MAASPTPPALPALLDPALRRRQEQAAAQERFDAAVAHALSVWEPGEGTRRSPEAWRLACNAALEAGKALPLIPLGWLLGR